MRIYGHEWPDSLSRTEIELTCFRNGLTPEQGGLGKAEHFWNYVKIRWPKMARHPWADDMVRCACEWNYLGVSGGSNIGKSQLFAAWAIANWECDPLNTIVLITSISLSGSRKRIWGYVEDLFNAIPAGGCPGKLVSSIGMIRTESPEHGIKASDRCGIALIAGDASKQKQAIGKFQGIHNKRVFLIGDELPELSPAVVNAAVSNLAGNEFFQFIGIGNPGSIYDPHGQLCTPEKGWASVSTNDTEWKTKLGWHIRFDGEKSPNILAARTVYPFLPTVKTYNDAVERLGANSLEFWKMWKGFWCPEGSVGGIYSEADLVAFDVHNKDVRFIGDPVPVAFMDVGYTNGGDASMAVFGRIGRCEEGFDMLMFDESLRITEDTTDKRTPRMTQIARKYILACQQRGIRKRHAGYDGTASGRMFGDLLEAMWHEEGSCYCVDFSGLPTDMQVGTRGEKASDVFLNRVSELWVVGRSFLQCGQLKGLSIALARQMIARLAETAKKNGAMVTVVEGKRTMRKRIGMSPDLADAYFGMLDLCRRLFKFRSLSTRARRRATAMQAIQEHADALEDSSVPVNPGDDLPVEEFAMPRKKIKGWAAPVEEGWGSMSIW